MKNFRILIGIMMFVLAVSLCVSSNANGRTFKARVNNSLFTCGRDQVKDADGNLYDTVRIASQCWMAENLNVGQRITGGQDQTDNSVIEKYCYENLRSNCKTDGGLYQWNELMQYSTTGGAQGICPTGWHIPTDWEWKVMEMNLGMSQTEADKEEIVRGTDEGDQLQLVGEPGFQALLSGWHDVSANTFNDKGEGADWWTSTRHPSDPYDPYYRGVGGEAEEGVARVRTGPENAASVRCVRD